MLNVFERGVSDVLKVKIYIKAKQYKIIDFNINIKEKNHYETYK